MLRRQFLGALASTAAYACAPAASLQARPAESAPLPSRSPLASIPDATFAARLDRVRALTDKVGGAAAFVTSGTTTFAYLTGASVERSERLIALVVPVAGDAVVLAPSFEVERLRRALRVHATLRGWEESEDPFAPLRGEAWSTGAARGGLVVEPHTEVATSGALSRAFPERALLAADDAFESLRVVKDDSELARIRRAIAITHDTFDRAFRELRPGVRDRDVSRAIAQAFQGEGYRGYALVQFGALSALPHGSPEGDALANETVVLIDGGCCVDGYWSDITRTRWFGGSPPDEFRRVVDVVTSAQAAAIGHARGDVPAEEVDRAARDVITKAGYGPRFTHRTGHGLGMDGHERIYIVAGNRTPLATGCVFTAEPGVYVPGRFGVRIEDDVLCHETGAEILAGA